MTLKFDKKKTLQMSKNAMSKIKIDIVQKLFYDFIMKNEISKRNIQLHQFLIFGDFIDRNTLLTSQDFFDTKPQFQNM